MDEIHTPQEFFLARLRARPGRPQFVGLNPGVVAGAPRPGLVPLAPPGHGGIVAVAQHAIP